MKQFILLLIAIAIVSCQQYLIAEFFEEDSTCSEGSLAIFSTVNDLCIPGVQGTDFTFSSCDAPANMVTVSSFIDPNCSVSNSADTFPVDGTCQVIASTDSAPDSGARGLQCQGQLVSADSDLFVLDIYGAPDCMGPVLTRTVLNPNACAQMAGANVRARCVNGQVELSVFGNDQCTGDSLVQTQAPSCDNVIGGGSTNMVCGASGGPISASFSTASALQASFFALAGLLFALF